MNTWDITKAAIDAIEKAAGQRPQLVTCSKVPDAITTETNVRDCYKIGFYLQRNPGEFLSDLMEPIKNRALSDYERAIVDVCQALTRTIEAQGGDLNSKSPAILQVERVCNDILETIRGDNNASG